MSKHLKILFAVLVATYSATVAWADSTNSFQLKLEQDRAEERWVIKVPKSLVSREDLHVELDIRADNSQEPVSYLAWEDNFNIGCYFVKFNQVNLKNYSARARVSSKDKELSLISGESNWMSLDSVKTAAPAEVASIPEQRSKTFARGMILFGAIFCWMLLLNSWLSLRIRELKRSARAPSAYSKEVSPELKFEVENLRNYSGLANRQLSDDEKLLFESNLDDLREGL